MVLQPTVYEYLDPDCSNDSQGPKPSHSFLSTPSPTKKAALGRRLYPIFKRVAEFVLSFALLILLIPFFLIIMLAIRIDSTGAPLFEQIRVGKDGKSFKMYKFRSMHADIDRDAHHEFMRNYIHGRVNAHSLVLDQQHGTVKPFQDSQVTRIGQFLRKTSLDELPQLINVLKGEMSFIGPRPNVPEEVEAYQEWHKQRLAVLPGITGWAQVSGRSSISFEHIVRCDLEYIQHQSLKMDLEIILRTMLIALKGTGAS